MIRRIGYKALVVVQSMEILNQFKDYFLNVMGLPKEDIGIIANGKVEVRKKSYFSITTNSLQCKSVRI